MLSNSFTDMDTLFDSVFNKLISPEFGKNLGGELPLYIQPVPSDQQSEVDSQLKRLKKRLEKKGIETLSINLYDLSMDILDEEGVLSTILESENSIPKDDIVATLDSILDIKSVIIPRIQRAISESKPSFVFISGVGSIYPFIRSHGILNNIDELTNDCNLVMFFPGDYNNLQLKLFGKISDENYYRGLNLNEINEI